MGVKTKVKVALTTQGNDYNDANRMSHSAKLFQLEYINTRTHLKHMKFYKYQATGNDFVMIDNRTLWFDDKNTSLVAKLCDRRFGVGADGLILLQNHADYDFEMVYYNADGNQSTMCGNGGRSIAQFAYDLGVIGESATFIAIDGPHDVAIETDRVKLKMIDTELPFTAGKDFFLDTGSPHHVRFVEDVSTYDVVKEGANVRYSSLYKNEGGTNVNFVSEIDEHTIQVRTYERGVEDETFSCGTGVTACAIVASLDKYTSPINIITKGGKLSVSFEEKEEAYENVWLCGPACQVFVGEIND